MISEQHFAEAPMGFLGRRPGGERQGAGSHDDDLILDQGDRRGGVESRVRLKFESRHGFDLVQSVRSLCRYFKPYVDLKYYKSDDVHMVELSQKFPKFVREKSPWRLTMMCHYN
jgi:hypothetical protein